MNRSRTLVYALAVVAIPVAILIAALVMARRPSTSPSAGRQPVSPPLSTSPGPGPAEQLQKATTAATDSEAQLVAKIIANRWWSKPPSAQDVTAMADAIANTNRGWHFWIQRNAVYEGWKKTGTPIDDYYQGERGKGPFLIIETEWLKRPTRHQVLSKILLVIELREYSDGPGR